MRLDAIQSRLGSISPKAMESLPAAVQKLLKEDLPALIEIVKKYDHCAPDCVSWNQKDDCDCGYVKD